MLSVKKCQVFHNLNLIKISLEIMLSDFAEKKETFFDLKKQRRTSGYMTRKYTLYTIKNVLIAALQKVVSTKSSVK